MASRPSKKIMSGVFVSLPMAVFSLLPASVSAQEKEVGEIASGNDKTVIVTDSVRIQFRINSSEIDWEFDGNKAALSRLNEYINPDADSLFVLREIRVVGGGVTGWRLCI